MPVATYANTQPLDKSDFWVLYSNLLLSYWSVPDVRQRLDSDPVGTLAFFQLPTIPNAKIQIIHDVKAGDTSFQAQYDLWNEGRETGSYMLYVPPSYPAGGIQGSSDINLVAAASADCCCCSCCPCCSCF